MSQTEDIGFYALPSTPKDRQRLLEAIENCRQAKVRIASEQTYIAETVKEFAKEFGIKAADLNRLIADRAKQSYGETVKKADIYQDLYESLFPNARAEAAADRADAEAEDEDEAPGAVVNDLDAALSKLLEPA